MEPVIRTTFIDVTNDLAEIGVSYDTLKESIIAGEYARNACTENDPPNGPGFIAWAKNLRCLRELLIPGGWTRSEYGIVRPDGKLAITVATGDHATGDPDGVPKTKYEKGATTFAAVKSNQEQFELFEQHSYRSIIAAARPDKMQTWMLLRNRVDEIVFCELSMPAVIGEDERVENWCYRIILPSITLEPNPMSDQSNEDQSVDIPIRRRS